MRVSELKRVEHANVYKAGRLAASLVRDAEGVVFSYMPQYDGPPVAFSLPREASPVRTLGGALLPFFSGLLPEGRRLTAIQRATKTSLDDELTLLLAVGRDTVGDVQVLPGTSADSQGAKPIYEKQVAMSQPTVEVQRFEECDFDELFSSSLDGELRDRTAIAGVQDKLSAWITIALPVGWAGASWILKLDPKEYPHLIANEAFFLSAARDSGLEVAESKVVRDRPGRAGLLVRRFDREPSATGLRSLAQEDGCQVLGRYPADRYRLSSEELILALSNCCAAPTLAARDLVRQFAFAYLTGNGDLHAKNVSILERGEWRVSPAYDLPSSLPYGDHRLALPIAGRSGEDVRRLDFIALGQQVGLPEKATIRILDDLLTKLPSWLARLETLPFEGRTLGKLRRSIEIRATRLAPAKQA